MSYVADELAKAAETYKIKNALYGDTYKRQGEIMTLFFPKGLNLDSAADWNRMGIMMKIIDKLIRYNSNFTKGGHEDSLHDISVYSVMLMELDNERIS